MKTPANLRFPSAPNIRSLFPDDLREWLDQPALATAARQAAEEIYWISADDEDPPPFGGCSCPLRKLMFFAYCYATGSYSTGDLEARLADDETVRELFAGARFSVEKLRLFRAHNSEIIKLCLTRVLEQAWAAKFGQIALRDFFYDEASLRLRRAVVADQSFTMRSPASVNENHVAGSQRGAFGKWLGAAALFFLLFLPWLAHGEDAYETLIINGNTNTNVRVVSANPAEVVVMFDGGGSTLKRTNLPPALRAKYPYDHAAATAFEEQKAAAQRTQREQLRREGHEALLRQERELQSRIEKVNGEIVSVQKEIRGWRSKPRGTFGKGVALDQLIDQKMKQERYVEELRKQLNAIRRSQAAYR